MKKTIDFILESVNNLGQVNDAPKEFDELLGTRRYIAERQRRTEEKAEEDVLEDLLSAFKHPVWVLWPHIKDPALDKADTMKALVNIFQGMGTLTKKSVIQNLRFVMCRRRIWKSKSPYGLHNNRSLCP